MFNVTALSCHKNKARNFSARKIDGKIMILGLEKHFQYNYVIKFNHNLIDILLES